MDINLNLNIFSTTWKIILNKRQVRLGIVIATVLAAMLASYWGSLQLYLLLMGGLVSVAGLLVLMRFPNLGYILVVVGGMFIPFAGPGGFNASILILILVAALWLMDMFIVRREFRFVKSPAIRPAGFLMIISVVALGMGQISWFSFARHAPLDAQLGGFAIYFFSLLTMVMMANMITDIRWLKAIVWVFIGLGTIYVLGNAAELTIFDKIYQKGVYANSMFWTWMVALCLGQALFNNDLKISRRAILYVIVAVTFFVAFYQQNDWKSGWVPPAVTAMALVGLRYKKLALAAIPFILIYGIYAAQSLISTDQYSWGTRVDAWIVVLDISRISPLFGLGFGNYYWYAPLFDLRGYNIRFNSHSQYVDLIAQTGIAGLACFVWILYEIGSLAWKLTTQVREGFARGYIYGVLGGVAGVVMAAFLVDWVLPFAYNIGLDGFRASIYPWIFFGGLIAIEQLYLAKKNL